MSDPASPEKFRRRRWAWLIGLILIAVVLVVAPVVREAKFEPSTKPVQIDSLEVHKSVSLTVPETVEIAEENLSVIKGQKYLITYTVQTVKPEGTPGRAMYFGVSLGCSGPEDSSMRSASGTQNLVTGEKVTVKNQFLLEAEETSVRPCRFILDSPSPDAAAAGTEISIQVSWKARPVGGRSFSIPSTERLPQVIDEDGRRPAFRQDFTLLEEVELRLAGTLHVTTCTMVNGSREGGEALCKTSGLDERGSSLEIDVKAIILDPEGNSCSTIEVADVSTKVDRDTHHKMIALDATVALPEEPCGHVLEIVVGVRNHGPAPLAIHSAGSSFLVIDDGQPKAATSTD